MSRLERLARRRAAPPPHQLKTRKFKAAIKQLRETVHGDAATMEVVKEAERLIAKGWTIRRGPFDPRPAKTPPEWANSPKPPDWGEK
jgi:hypothetical protein